MSTRMVVRISAGVRESRDAAVRMVFVSFRASWKSKQRTAPRRRRSGGRASVESRRAAAPLASSRTAADVRAPATSNDVAGSLSGWRYVCIELLSRRQRDLLCMSCNEVVDEWVDPLHERVHELLVDEDFDQIVRDRDELAA